MPAGKSKNKRFVRRHVLKVKIRASQRRQLVTRRLAWSAALLLLLAVAVGVSWQGAQALARWAVLENPHFAINRLVIENDGLIRNDQIAQWAGIRQDLNLFSLDLNRVRRDLELLPVIAAAEVERVLPDTIRIRVREREPVARYAPQLPQSLSASDHTLYTIDRAGYVMAPLQPHQLRVPQGFRVEHLPFLQGLPRQDIRPGYPIESPQAQAALQLIDAFAQSPMAGFVKIHAIDVSQPGVLEVQTSTRTRVTFGLAHFPRQILRWRAAHDLGRRSGKTLLSLDLSVTNNLPLRWQEAGSAAPPHPAQPSA